MTPKTFDWHLTYTFGLGDEFKSLETAVMSYIWFDATPAQNVMRQLSNEENQ